MVCMTWTANGPVRNPCVRANRDKLISVNFGNLILTQRLSSHSGNIGVDTVYRDSRDSLSIVRKNTSAVRGRAHFVTFSCYLGTICNGVPSWAGFTDARTVLR